MHRAAHQLLDRPLVFEDPLALAIIGQEAERELRAGTDWHGFAAPGLRAFIVARARYTEGVLAEALERGVTQYIVLGAGLETELHDALRALGLRELRDLNAPALNACYYSGRNDGLRIGGHGHLVHVRW